MTACLDFSEETESVLQLYFASLLKTHEDTTYKFKIIKV